MGIIHTERIAVDFEKSCEKLASLYAKSKLDEAIATKKFDGTAAPIEVEQMEYLANEYYFALGYFSNMTEDYVKHLVDPE